MNKIFAVLIALIFAVSAHAENIGLEAGKESAAFLNTLRLSKAGSATPPKIVDWPTGTVYVLGTATTRQVAGCGRWNFPGAGGYPIEPTPQWGQVGTRIVQLGKGPILRLAGAGFITSGPVELVGDGESAIIEVEGNRNIASGRHHFEHLLLHNAGVGIRCLAGYYKEGNFVPDENHADNSTVDICETANIRTVFESLNQQSLNWTFRKLTPNVLGEDDTSCCVADIFRGGMLTIHELNIEHPHLTALRLHDYSPNQCRFVFGEIHGDCGCMTGFTAVEYAGPDNCKSFADWSLKLSGFLPPNEPPNELFKNCDGLPQGRWEYEGLVGVAK